MCSVPQNSGPTGHAGPMYGFGGPAGSIIDTMDPFSNRLERTNTQCWTQSL